MTQSIQTPAALRARHCTPQASGDALDQAFVDAQLAALPGWSLRDGALERAYRFDGYPETIRFVDAVAAMADAQDHHPRMIVDYGRCTVRWNTHSVDGISINDFICAARCDALGDGATH
ncbi:MAG: 4a-hydroxytetrahydrobiopterin dehydratase [Burkholderiaceae bacterium]